MGPGIRGVQLEAPLRSRHTSIGRARGLCRRPIVPEAEKSTPVGDASFKVPSHFRWTIPLVTGRRMQIKPGTRAVPGCVTLMHGKSASGGVYCLRDSRPVHPTHVSRAENLRGPATKPLKPAVFLHMRPRMRHFARVPAGPVAPP